MSPLIGYTVILVAAALVCFLWGRIAAAAVRSFAKGKGVTLSVNPISVLRITGLSLKADKGPVSKVLFADFRLFRDAEWLKTLEVWFRDGLFPVFLQSLHLSINPMSQGSASSHHQKSQTSEKEGAKSETRNAAGFTQSLVSKFLLWMLPRIPFTAYDIQLELEGLGIVVMIPGLALLFKADHKTSRLQAALKITEVKMILKADDAGGDSQEEHTVATLSEATLRASVALEWRTSHRLSYVDAGLGEISILLSEVLLEMVAKHLQSGLKHGARKSSKRTRGKERKPGFHPQEILHKLPGECGLSVKKIQIQTDTEHSPLRVVAGVTLGSLGLTAHVKDGNKAVQLESVLGPLSINAGILQDERIFTLDMPNIKLEAGAKWCEEETFHVNGLVDVQGPCITARGEALPKMILEGLDFAREWEAKVAGCPLIETVMSEALSEGDSLETQESQGDSTGVRGKKLFSGNPLLAQTDALFNKKKVSVLVGGESHGDRSAGESDPDFGCSVTDSVTEAPDIIGDDAAVAQAHAKGEDNVEEPIISLTWKAQVKLSQTAVIHIEGKESKPLVSVVVDSIWVQGESVHGEVERVSAGQQVEAEFGIRGLRMNVANEFDGSGISVQEWSLFGLGYGGVKASTSFVNNRGGGLVEEQVTSVQLIVKQLEVEASQASVNSVIAIGKYALDQVELVMEGIDHRERPPSQPKGEAKGKKQMNLDKIIWKLDLKDMGVKYSTDMLPLEAYSVATKSIPCTLAMSFGGIDAESWEHWSGGQAVAKNVKLNFSSGTPEGFEYTTVLWVENVQTKMEERGGAIGVQIIGNQGQVKANIDMLLFAMHVATDAGRFKHDFLELAGRGKALKRTNIVPRRLSATSQPRTPRPRRPLLINVCVHSFDIEAKIGEQDSVSVVILEAHTDTRMPLPRVYVKQIRVCMNGSQLVQCKGVNLTVSPPGSLQAVEERAVSGTRLRRSTGLRSRERELAGAKLAVDVNVLGDRVTAASPMSTRTSNTPPQSEVDIDKDVGGGVSIGEEQLGNLSLESIHGSRDSVDEDMRGGGGDFRASRSTSCLTRRWSALNELGLLALVDETEGEGIPVLQIQSIQIEMESLCISLPHDQHFGRLILFLELWVDAVKEVVVGYISQLKEAFGGEDQKEKDKMMNTGSRKEPPAVIELVIKSQHLSFQLDAHPMEAWMALHGSALRSVAMQQHVWESALESTTRDMGESPIKREVASMKAKEWVMRELFKQYHSECKAIKSQIEDELHHHGALMSVVSGAVDGLILIGSKSHPKVFEASVKNIRELDKPMSDDIQFSKVQPIYIDGRLASIVAHFGGQHAANISEIGFKGLLVRGRQMTHPPKMETEVFQVGRWHKVERSLPIKGAQPPMKVYTKMDATLNGMQAQASIGLEPIWAQLAIAFNRLSPPSGVHSDGHLKTPGPTLHPWDKMRYTWRGSLGICIRQMAVAFGASVNPVVTVQSERIELNADKLDIKVTAGTVNIHTLGMKIDMFMAGLRSAPEDPLHTLPLGHLPNALIKFTFDWLMPNGRDPLDHHAHPKVSEPNPSIRLDPVDLTKDFVGEGYTMSIDAILDGEENVSKEKVLEVPHVTLGEPQIRFLVRFVNVMEGAPIYVRGCWKRGTYFVKKKKKSSVGPELPTLLHRLHVSAKSRTIEVRHHTLEPDDPSSDMVICCESVRFAGTWGFVRNIEQMEQRRRGIHIPRRRYEPVDGIWRLVQGPKQPPDMENLEVEAYQIQGFLPEKHGMNPLLNRSRMEAMHNSFLKNLLSRKASKSMAEEFETTTPPPTGSEGHILSASCFWLRQLGGPGAGSSSQNFDVHITMPSGQKKRPLKIMVEDVKVLVPLEVRNAVLGVFMHMNAAFTGPPQPANLDLANAARKTKYKMEGDAELEPISKHNSATGEAQYLQESSLLRALLAQDASSKVLDDYRADHSFSMGNVDQPPPGSKTVLELEFMHVQLGFVSDVSEGAVLLTLDSGTLHENVNEQMHIRLMGLNVDHVQCYAMDTSIDPLNPVRWLEVHDGRLEIPKDSSAILTRIVKPFRVQMSDTHLLCMGQVLNPGRAAEELKLTSPRIEAVTESSQYETLVDVINSIATPPPPRISLLRDSVLGATGSALEDTNEDILQAKEMLRAVYVEFNARRQEAHDVWCASGHGPVDTMGRSEMFEESVSSKRRAAGDRPSSSAHNEMQKFIQSFLEEKGKKGKEAPGKESMGLLQLVLDDQIEVARMSCMNSARHLAETRKDVEEKNKHKKLFKSMHMTFGVHQVSWKLRKDGADFVEASIQGVTYSSFQNMDLSGESKISVHRIQLLDTQGVIGPTPGLDSGVVLSVLGPAGADEEMLRGLAVRGGQTSSHVYYEHIEVWVHPLGLHITERLAREIAAYFFGSDESDLQKEQEDFVKGVGTSPSALRRANSNLSNSDSETETTAEPTELSMTSTQQGSGSSQSRLQGVVPTTPRTQPEYEGDPLKYLMETKPPPKKRRRKGLAKRRKLHFVHVRFNRVKTKITYEGRPFPISNLDIIIQMNEYNNVQGQFNDILRKYRNNCITSVLKSAAHFLGRRYDPDELIGDKGGRRRGVRERIRDRLKKNKPLVSGGEADMADVTGGSEELRKQQKAKKMLLGEP